MYNINNEEGFASFQRLSVNAIWINVGEIAGQIYPHLMLNN